MARRRNYRGPREKGNRGGPRRAYRTIRAMEWEQRHNPGWFGTLLIAGIAAAGAYVLIARPDLPGELDDWIYDHIPAPGELLVQGDDTPGDAGDPDDDGSDATIIPSISDATITAA